MSKIQDWLDGGFGEFSSYRRGYLLSHPWKIVEAISQQTIWAWQRVFRGWDDRVIWSIDYYLEENIPQWMKGLKEKGHGIPSVLAEDYDLNLDTHEGMQDGIKVWGMILDDIAEGFIAKRKLDFYEIDSDDIEAIEEAEKSFNKAMSLFVKYFGDFWD